VIDYTDKPARQEFPTPDDVLAFSRFVYNASAGGVHLSPAAASDALGVCGILARAEEEHYLTTKISDGVVFRRALDVADASLRILASQIAASLIMSNDRAEKLRSVAKLAAADIPAVDAIYAIRRALAEGGE
jgi:hypothetical protein